MDLTKYKKQLNSLRQAIINVELAEIAYRTAEEALSFGMIGASERVKQAKEHLEMTERTLESQSRINCLLNQEVVNEH